MKQYLLLLLVVFYGCKSSDKPAPTPVPPVVTPPVDVAGTFQNPILPDAPDPWVTYKDGFYYFMRTTDSDLRIYKTASMSKLAEATSGEDLDATRQRP